MANHAELLDSIGQLGGYVKRINLALLLGVVTLIALLLRIWGISSDLPYIYHPDEPVAIRISLRMFQTGDMNPHFFDWPSLLFYVNFLAYIPYYLYGTLAGVFQSPQSILAPVGVVMGGTYAPMPTIVLLGRALSAGFGIGSVILAYLIGERLTKHVGAGLLAALLVALNPTAVWHSHWITPDAMAAFFTLASAYFALRIYQEGRTRYYILAAVCVGLGASSKYNAALAILPLVVAHFLRYGRQSLRERNLYIAIFLSGLAFLHTTPFALLDFHAFGSALIGDSAHYSTGHPGMEGNTVRWYLNYLWNTTGPIPFLALLGMVWGIVSRSREVVLLSSFPVVYLLFISRFAVRNDRTLLPALAFLLILAVVALFQLYDRVARSPSRAIRYPSIAGLGVVALVVIVLMSSRTIQQSLELDAVNSRETARIWIEENLPPGSVVALEGYAPFLDPERYSLHGLFSMIDQTPDWFIEHGFEYLVFSQDMFGRFYEEPERYAAEIAQYDALFGRFELVKLFTDGGYEVRIYRVTPGSGVPPEPH